MSELLRDENGRIIFTKEMKKEYTILAPNMAPIHFELICNALSNHGYKVELLRTQGPNIVQEGLKYVHNDTCYPALLVIGQFIDALNSGKYDVNKTALLISQTGGGCRASNYIHLLRKALIKAGYGQVPVVSINLSGLEKNPGFKVDLKLLRQLIGGLVYGDLLMLLSNQVRPYEINAGESDQLVNKWITKLTKDFYDGKGYSLVTMEKNLNTISDEFAQIKTEQRQKIKVGVVGEIYVKYSSLANNNLEEFLASQDCEIMVPGIMGFALFKVDNRLEDIKLYGGSHAKFIVMTMLMDYLTKMESAMIKAVSRHEKFVVPSSYAHIKTLIKGVIGYGSKMGEGWLLTAEMLELAEQGYENIVCTQPFGCLPNHINGKGMIRKIREVNNKANIVPIDYDPSATRVNQENRIKLMLAVAKENLAEETAAKEEQQKTKEDKKLMAKAI